MKKILLLLLITTTNAFGLEVGDFYKEDAQLIHLMGAQSEQISSLSDRLNNHEFLVLEFFLTTCSACRENRPIFMSLARDLSHKAVFKFVGIDNKESTLRSFYQSQLSEIIFFPYVLDNKRIAAKSFNIQSTPTSFILDRNNRIIYKHEGVFSKIDLEKINELIN